MDTYTLTRTESGNDGVFGQLSDDAGNVLAVTCEPPDGCNGPDTCIPAGTYTVIPHDSPAHPNTWEISGVPNRTAILIHDGNTDKDTLGCVVVGDRMGFIDGLRAVLDSRITLNALRGELPQTFILEIIEDYE
jgi:hypothetical protein